MSTTLWEGVCRATLASALLLGFGASPAQAEMRWSRHIDDSNYWHHAYIFWDDEDPDGYGVVVWFKDPDPDKAVSGEWCQSVDDCDSYECLEVVGRMPIYSPGRVSGLVISMDSDTSDPCQEIPASTHHILKGDGVDVWVYRSADLIDVFTTNDYCLETEPRDANGDPIFDLRRIVTHLETYPRIAEGQLDFSLEGSEWYGAPHTSASIRGLVSVERDPATMAPYESPRQGRFDLVLTEAGTHLLALQSWYAFLAEIGIECDQPRPNPSEAAFLHAGTSGVAGDNYRVRLRLSP